LLTTERLLLRQPTVADVEDPPAFLRDPEVVRWLGGLDDPHVVVRRWLEQWETHPAGKFVVETRDGRRIGRVGLNFYDPATWARSRADDARPEVTWAIAREEWGNGYATEAALAVRAWFKAPAAVSLIEPANIRSIRVAEKLGCARTDEVATIDGVACEVWLHPPGSRPNA
jgi:RimJ/RimL family protein N-acetyltransferase